MASLQGMVKKCRLLEQKEKWKELSEAYNQLGRMFSERGKYKDALMYHTKDKEVCEMTQDISGQAQAHRMMGETLADLARYKEALEQQKQYLAMSRQLQDPVMEQRALATLGRTFLYIAETDTDAYDKSIKYFSNALKSVSKIPKKDIDAKERASMTGRALENIGIASWHLGKDSEEFFSRAVSMYRDNKLWEDLCRVTDIKVSFLLVSASPSDLSLALTCCEASLDAAQKVHNSVKQNQCKVTALFTKSKVLLLKEEWEDARECLIRARGYKVETDISAMVINNLKMLIVLLKLKEEIMAKMEGKMMSHSTYEQIGDALTKFQGNAGEVTKVLGLALKYYKMAYSRADNEGTMEALPALNNSIALTYKDMGDFDNALVFFERQLELEKGKYEELGSTYSNIASVRESLKCSFQQVLHALIEWEQCAIKVNNVGEQIMALQEVVRVQELDGQEREAMETRKKIEKLGGSPDSEEPSSQGSAMSDNFPEVDLDLVEPPVVRVGEARRTPAIFKNKNERGEYPLHLKVQKPNQESEVISMIERGHPLEVEDNCGWTPLGEAMGHMNLSYIKILVNAGANVNHRNMSLRDSTGDTPLLSACARGFLDGIEYLLGVGAKVDLKNKKGESCLAWLRKHLKDGRKGKDETYKQPGVMDRLESALNKVEAEYTRLGLSTEYNLPSESDSMELDDDDESDTELDRTLRSNDRKEARAMITSTQRRSSTSTGHARRQVSRSPSPDNSLPSLSPTTPTSRESTPSPTPKSRCRPYPISRSPSPNIRAISPSVLAPTQAYKDAIAGVRSSTKSALQPLSQLPRKNTESVKEMDEGFDWIVDDVGEKKKRKRPIGENILSDKKKIRNLDSRRENLSPSPSASIDLTNSPDLKPSQKSLTSKLSKKNKVIQPKIYQSLPSTTRPVSPSFSSLPPTTTIPTPAPITNTTVRVTIEGERFLIPVPTPDKTVSWLAGEASARYYRLTGSEPVIRLTTGDGDGLDPGDLVMQVVQGSAPVVAVVTSWNCKPAEERYRDSCKDMGTSCFKGICDKLALMASNNTLSLSVPLKTQNAAPIFHCLRSNIGLRELSLSRCKLSDTTMALLVTLLPTLSNLSSLDLSQNMLSIQSLKLLSGLKLPLLSHLSLSLNPLGDLSLPSLTAILSMGPIISLNLSHCMLTKSLFQTGRPEFSEAMKKSKLTALDVSQNNFDEVGVEILVKTLPSSLRHLNLSACINSPTPQSLGSTLSAYCMRGNPTCELTSINLSSLSISDNILNSILPIFFHCGRLSVLNLSHNPLTVSGIASLLKSLVEESVPLITLESAQTRSASATFWSDKFAASDLEYQLESILTSNCSRLEYFSLPDQMDLVVPLKKVWDKAWGSRSRHSKDGMGNIVLSIG